MILMLNDGEKEFMIDKISFLSISDFYTISRNSQVFRYVEDTEEKYGKSRYEKEVLEQLNGVSKVFLSKKHDQLFTRTTVDSCDFDTDHTQSLCPAIGLDLIIEGSLETIVFSIACHAYICNDEGKTIRKLC